LKVPVVTTASISQTSTSHIITNFDITSCPRLLY